MQERMLTRAMACSSQSAHDNTQTGSNDTGTTAVTTAQLTAATGTGIQRGASTPTSTTPIASQSTEHMTAGPAASTLPDSTAAIQSDSGGQLSDANKQSLTSALASLRLPGPGYELESLPPTPTMLDRSSPSYSTSQHRPFATTYQSSDFPQEQRRSTSTPALSNDPMHALKVSISQGGGFYMSAENQARASQAQSILTSAAEESQFRPPTSSRSLSESRSLSSDSEQDYFSISSISPSSSLSSRRGGGGGNELSFSHSQEDSGYSPAEHYYRENNIDSFSRSNDASPIFAFDVRSSEPRRLQRPNLTLHDNNNSPSQRKSLKPLSRSETFMDLSQYDEYPLKTPSAAQTFQDNLTPRMSSLSSSDWPTNTSQPYYETPNFGLHRENSHDTRYATSPADQLPFGTTKGDYAERAVYTSSSATHLPAAAQPTNPSIKNNTSTALIHLADQFDHLRFEQYAQRREITRQNDELEKQYKEIQILKAQVVEADKAKMQSSGGYPGVQPSYTTSQSTSPAAEVNNPFSHMNEYNRQALYSSNPATDPSAQYALPAGPSRRRVTVSELQQSPRGQVSTFPMSGSVPTTRLHSPVNNFSNRQSAQAGPPAGSQLPPRFGPGPHSHPSTPNQQQGPFFALAAASGVVLSEQEAPSNAARGNVSRQQQHQQQQQLNEDASVNYQALLKQILDRNDQQASIFLQQKLKSCTDPYKRMYIIDCVLPYAFHLVTNRFGNFIVSRCLDLGTEQQKAAIARTMLGSISNMAADTYGSHVIQRAIDDIPGFDEIVVTELVRDPKSFTNKSAGHVWSKILANARPPPNLYPLLKSVRDWSQIAMDETGSLLCQAVLENWPVEEKAGIVKGLIRDTITLCSSQWATFVVLHLIEHGMDDDRNEIFKILLSASVAISQDQYGAKAIEKMIKAAGMSSDTVKSYVSLICDASQGRPAVVSICQTANGSQIVTLLLTNAPSELKEVLIEAIRRHGVTLKGSKHGSRIWFVVERARAWRGH